MAKWGKCDYRQLQQLQNNLAKAQNPGMDELYESAAKELARKFLQLVIRRTPVGIYDGNSYTCAMGFTHHGHRVKGKVGGTLRRGWTAKSQGEAESGSGSGLNNITAVASSLPVKKVGHSYTVDIINPVEYASYVEFGHRTQNGGFVPGHYFMTHSEEDVKTELLPGVLERLQAQLLKEIHDI